MKNLLIILSVLLLTSSCKQEQEFMNSLDAMLIGALIVDVAGTEYTLKPDIDAEGKILTSFSFKTNNQEDTVSISKLALRKGATSELGNGSILKFTEAQSPDSLFVRSESVLPVSHEGQTTNYAIIRISDAPSTEIPFLYFVSTNAAEIDEENTPRLQSVNDDGVYEGFVKIVSDWDNVGLLTKNKDILYDVNGGFDAGVSSAKITLDERTLTSEDGYKPNGPWGQWAFSNPSMLWYFTFNTSPDSRELTALSTKIALDGSALSAPAELMYDAGSKTWSVETEFTAGGFKLVTLPITAGDAVLSFGDGGAGKLLKDAGEIAMSQAGTYTIVLDLARNTYAIKGIVNPDDDDKIMGSYESKFRRYVEGQLFEGNISTTWSDTAWIGDRIHKQIILWSDNAQFDGITYEVSDLSSGSATIPQSNVRLRFGSYVIGDREANVCGIESRNTVKIADALQEVPVTSLPANNPVKMWVTVDIPQNASAGTYAGNIKVKYNGEVHQEFAIETRVVNHRLPEPQDWEYHLDIWQFPFQLANLVSPNAPGGWLKPFTPEYFTIQEPFYKMLADAGQKTITTYIKDGAFRAGETMVNWNKWGTGEDEWYFDFTPFESHVTKMMEWGITKQISVFSLVGWDTRIAYWDTPSETYTHLDYEIGSDEYNAIWTRFLTDFKTFLDGKGWFDKVVLYMDEIETEEMTAVIDLIKGHNAAWKIGVSGRNQTPANESRLYDYSTILNTTRTNRSPVSTFYTSCSQTRPNNYVAAQSNPAELTWMAWHTMQQDLDGYLRWAFDYWTKSDPTDAQDGRNTAGDFHMIYRTDNTLNTKPVSSIRWELLREGIQDFEKIRILNNAALDAHIAKFNATSGVAAEQLVQEAQTKLKQVAVQ